MTEACETRNMSSAGILFQTSEPIEVGEFIEYFITLPPTAESAYPVRLHCKGKVVRRDAVAAEGVSRFAATLERYEFVRKP